MRPYAEILYTLEIFRFRLRNAVVQTERNISMWRQKREDLCRLHTPLPFAQDDSTYGGALVCGSSKALHLGERADEERSVRKALSVSSAATSPKGGGILYGAIGAKR